MMEEYDIIEEYDVTNSYAKSENGNKNYDDGLSKSIEYKNGECDRRDLKLKEAEKTIANKDVIIKMLQNQIKKMEESYKKNVIQTEEFRYKYCLAAEKIQQLRLCPNRKAKEKQQIQGMFCYNQNILDEKKKQRCNDNFPLECFPKDVNECTESFMKNHYRMLQILVDQIINKRCPNLTCPEKETNEKNDKHGIICYSSNCMENKITELQEKIDKLEKENARLQEKMDNVQVEQQALPATNNIVDDKKTSSETKNEEAEENKTNQLSEQTTRRKVSFPISETINSCGCIRKIKNVIEKDKPDLEVTNDIEKKEDRPKASGSTEIRDTNKASEPSPDDDDDNDQNNNENEKVVAILAKSGSIVSAVDSLTIHQKHLSISRTKEDTDEELTDVRSSTNDSTGLRHSKPSVSFHAVPVDIIEKYQEDKKTRSNNSIEQEECMATHAFSEEPLTEINKEKESPRIQKPPTPKQNCTSDLQEIKNTIVILVEKQENTFDELREIKNQINTTYQSTEPSNGEISKLKEAVEAQKNMILDNLQDNKVIKDNLTQLSDRLSNELKEVRNKIEAIIKSVDELRQQKHGKSVDVVGNKHQPAEDDGSCITIEKVQDEVLKTHPKGASGGKLQGSLETNRANTIVLQKTDEGDKLEEKYSELKKQKLQKDQQIKCLNNLIDYYNKLNQEVLCLCPGVPSNSEESSKAAKDATNDNKTSVGNKKEQKIVGKEQEQCICSPSCTKGPEDININHQRNTVDHEPIEGKKSEEMQIEDIYSAVLKCTKKTSSSYTPKNVKSIMCGCNVNLDKYVKEDKVKRKVSIEDIYEAVRCSCKQRRENSIEDKNHECTSSVSSCSLGNCLLHYDTFVCDKTLQPNLETYVNYLHEQLNVISTIENQIENLRTDIKSSHQ